MKIFIFLALSIYLVSAVLYPSIGFKHKNLLKRGIQPKPFKPVTVNLKTICNIVNLNVPPYNHNGIVRSGYLSVRPQKLNSVLAFFFFGKQNASAQEIMKTPTLIWMNGGPGSSSQFGNLMELGPYRIVADPVLPYRIIKNNYTWIKEYNVLFVDQPVGTGLGYADPLAADPFVHSMDDVAQDFYNALKELYLSPDGCFNKLGISPSSDLYIFGESYAGKYVPSISAKILQQKQIGGFLTGLKGMGIGDPFTHPFYILSQVNGFAFNLGLIDYQQRNKIQQLVLNATFQERNKQWSALHDTFDEILECIIQWAGNINVYDIRSYHDYDDYLLNNYFDDPITKQLFGLNPQIVYDAQADDVYDGLYQDFMKPEVSRVEYCLDKNLPTIVYNGQDDLIVQTPGTMRWVSRLTYKDSQTFKNTIFKTWKVGGKVAGSIKSAGFLQLRIVFNAGHLVPMDEGQNSLQMVKTFINKYKQIQLQAEK